MADTNHSVAFFLGAGASVEADVPDTTGLIKTFLNVTKDEKLTSLIAQLTAWAGRNGRTVDIELVLAILESIAQWQENPMSSVATVHSLPEAFDSKALLVKLREFIKSAVLVRSDKIQYLAPLRGFVSAEPGLRIFSANYDTAIELFCIEHKLRYRDGFDESWNKSVFDDKNVDVLLFKLHGSITWYRTDRGRFIKLPILTADSNVELVTRERAQLLMLYPAQKFDYVEPLFELLLESKRELSKVKTLVVVGYTFRDEHIRHMFWDIARDNPHFNIVLVDPRAKEIYESRLKLYEDGATPSSLYGRVVPMPFLFGKIFPHLQPTILFLLHQAWTTARALQDQEFQGRFADWEETTRVAARGGHYQLAERVLTNPESMPQLQYRSAFEIAAFGLFHAAANNDVDGRKRFWGALKEFTTDFSKSFWLNVQAPKDGMELIFDMTRSPHGGQIRMGDVLARLKELSGELDQRLGWLAPSTRDRAEVRGVAQFLGDLSVLWEVLSPHKVSLQGYLDDPQRAEVMSEILKTLLQDLKNHTSMTLDGVDRKEQLARLMQIVEEDVLAVRLYNKYNPILG